MMFELELNASYISRSKISEPVRTDHFQGFGRHVVNSSITMFTMICMFHLDDPNSYSVIE